MSDQTPGDGPGIPFRMVGEPAEACAGGVCAWPPADKEALYDAPDSTSHFARAADPT
jgi:hypothetical protein